MIARSTRSARNRRVGAYNKYVTRGGRKRDKVFRDEYRVKYFFRRRSIDKETAASPNGIY